MHQQSIRPDAKRDADAAMLAEMAHTWPVVTLKQPFGAFPIGSVFYGVPSRSKPGARYLANAVACQCPDYQQRGAICAHVRAVVLYEAARQQTEGSAEQADPTSDEALGLASEAEVELYMIGRYGTERTAPVKRYEDLFGDDEPGFRRVVSDAFKLNPMVEV